MNANKIEQLINSKINDLTTKELALGYLRYEKLRTVTPTKFNELHKRNMNGERFDGMIDELITEP